jgi:hypothetical protein
MKHYYIIKNRITDFNYELNPAEFNYQKLTSEQVDFYLANKTASINEVLNLTLNVPTPFVLADYKEQCINELSNLSIEIRQSFLPDYKIQNALLSIDGYQNKSLIYAEICDKYRKEFYRVKDLITSKMKQNTVDDAFNTNTFENLKNYYLDLV